MPCNFLVVCRRLILFCQNPKPSRNSCFVAAPVLSFPGIGPKRVRINMLKLAIDLRPCPKTLDLACYRCLRFEHETLELLSNALALHPSQTSRLFPDLRTRPFPELESTNLLQTNMQAVVAPRHEEDAYAENCSVL